MQARCQKALEATQQTSTALRRRKPNISTTCPFHGQAKPNQRCTSTQFGRQCTTNASATAKRKSKPTSAKQAQSCFPLNAPKEPTSHRLQQLKLPHFKCYQIHQNSISNGQECPSSPSLFAFVISPARPARSHSRRLQDLAKCFSHFQESAVFFVTHRHVLDLRNHGDHLLGSCSVAE